MKTIVAAPSLEGLFLFADSAAGRETQPLFVPDGEWTGSLRLAVRIRLLGKAISPAFVPRHADAWGVVLVMHPAGQPLPSWLGIMDSAVTTGRWLPLGASDTALSYEAILPCGERVTAGPFSLADASEAVSLVSQVATLKTGDIIIPPMAGQPDFALRPNTRVEVPDLLSVKIK